jgi:hypothetical protein
MAASQPLAAAHGEGEQGKARQRERQVGEIEHGAAFGVSFLSTPNGSAGRKGAIPDPRAGHKNVVKPLR